MHTLSGQLVVYEEYLDKAAIITFSGIGYKRLQTEHGHSIVITDNNAAS